MTIPRALTALLVAACFAAALPAAAAQAAPPSSAQRFADAALRMKIAVNAQKAEVSRRLEELDLFRCVRAVENAPERVSDRVFTIIGVAFLQPMLDVATPALHQLVRDLDAIPTRDPILRSGRAAWRASIAGLARWPRVDAPCDALERWRDAKWRASAAPKFSLRALERLIEESEADSQKLRRAARRLRELGVSRGAAERFTGDTMLEELIEESALDEIVAAVPRGQPF